MAAEKILEIWAKRNPEWETLKVFTNSCYSMLCKQ